jgi:hypothetical protein
LNFGFSDLFRNGKSVDSVHASWTTASGRSTVDPHGGVDGETAGERPGWRSSLPLLTDGGWEGEGWYGDSPWGSPELGERRSGRATRVNWWRWWSSVGGVFRCGRGGEGHGEWCGVLRGGGSPFIGARGGCRAAIMAGIGGEMGCGVKGDLSAIKL